MSHISNPLATQSQLYQTTLSNALPVELQDSIRFYTARLTQAAGILLRLPQDITAQANILLFRYWLIDDLLAHEFSDVSAAVIYLTAKISAAPRSLRSITNVYAYLASPFSSLSTTINDVPDVESYYLSETAYILNRKKLLYIEGQILAALGFSTHVALPHPLAITYLQTLDIFSPAFNSKDKNMGKAIGRRAIEHLNTALLSPQMLYLTHQPCALATAAVYLAAREIGVRLPENEWWEVFDCEREELGFLVVGMGSVEGLVRREMDRWGGKVMIKRSDVKEELGRLGTVFDNGNELEDEEAEMSRILDAKVGDE